MPNLGIASLGANLDEDHEVFLIDLIRKRRSVRQYLQRTLLKLRPDVVGLSTMTWQFGTCLKIVRLVRQWLPQAKIVVGGYHATLMSDEIGRDPGAREIDFLVRGEGEEAFRRLVNALAGRDDVAAIPRCRTAARTAGSSTIEGRAAGPRAPQAPHPRPAAPHVGLPHHGPQRGGHRDLPRLHPLLQLLQHPAHVRPVVPAVSHRARPRRHRRHLPQAAQPLDLRLRRQHGPLAAPGHRAVPGHHRPRLPRPALRRPGRLRHHVAQRGDGGPDGRGGLQERLPGIESASRKNLKAAQKGDILDASRKAWSSATPTASWWWGHDLRLPRRRGAGLRRQLPLPQGDRRRLPLLPDPHPLPQDRHPPAPAGRGARHQSDDFSTYNGIWANVRTRHLDSDTLQYQVWYQRQQVLGWVEPSRHARKQGPLWIGIWLYLVRPVLKVVLGRASGRSAGAAATSGRSPGSGARTASRSWRAERCLSRSLTFPLWSPRIATAGREP